MQIRYINQNIEKYRIRAKKNESKGRSPKAKGCLGRLHVKVIFLEILGFIGRRKSSSYCHSIN